MTHPSADASERHLALEPAPDPCPHRMIDTASALAEAVDRWRQAPAVALDTEFVRERTFYPGLGLIQVAVDSGDDSDLPEITLVDPVAIDDLSPLAALLNAPAVVKVLHSASEDAEVFKHHLGCVPRPLFDTQIAAGFCGYRPSMGLANLVDEILGIHLPKGETRSKWLRRPLRDAQRHYAALDVAYLLELHRRLGAELDRLGRTAWSAEDAEALVAAERWTAAGPWLNDKLWNKLGRGARPAMNGRQLAALRELIEWREQHARQRDLPRGFVLPDGDLTPLARALPTSRSAVRRIRSLDERKLSRQADRVVAAIDRALALDEDALPTPFTAAVDLSRHKKWVERLRRQVREIAESLNLAPELLASRRTIERLARRYLEGREPMLPQELRGWRAQAVGAPLLAEIERSAPAI